MLSGKLKNGCLNSLAVKSDISSQVIRKGRLRNIAKPATKISLADNRIHKLVKCANRNQLRLYLAKA